MRLADRMRTMIDGMPEGSSVMIPVCAIAEWLKTESVATSDAYTLEDLKKRYRKSISTVRGWCQQGLFPGAYKLNGKAWQVPVSAVVAFELWQRNAPARVERKVVTTRGSRGRSGRNVDTSAWRKAGNQ